MKNHKELFETLISGRKIKYAGQKPEVFLTQDGRLSMDIDVRDPRGWQIVPEVYEFECEWLEDHAGVVYPDADVNIVLDLVGKRTWVKVEVIDDE